MRIDSHQHFWIYNSYEFGWIDDSMSAIQCNFMPLQLLEEQKKAGFDGTIAVQARQSIEETEWLLKLADQYPFIKGVVGWVDLCSPFVKEQINKFASHPKFVGVRHVVQGEPDDDFILRDDFNRGVALLREFNLTYDILVYPKHLPYAVKFVEKYPDLTFVLDHIAKPLIKDQILLPWKDDIKLLATFPNVYCKVSGMVTEANWKTWKPEDFKPYLDVVFEAFGMDRMLIGSDWPVCLIGGDYTKVLSIVTDYITTQPKDIQEKILGGNCIKAYNIK